MKRRMMFGLIAGMVPFLYGEVIYENDFSTRTSAGTIPTTNWFEMPYHVGVLARNYNKNWNGAGTPYEQPGQIQDGWAQTHVHRVGVAIQPSCPLSSPSPPAPNPSQHQSLFQ